MTMITPSYLGETIEYSSLHACRSTLEDPTPGCLGNYAELARSTSHLSISSKSKKKQNRSNGSPFTMEETMQGSGKGDESILASHGGRLSVASKPVVALIDDEESVRKSLVRLIQAADHRVAAFASALEFLESVVPEVASCVVLDLRMPGLNSIQLQELLHGKIPFLSIVFVTGHGDLPASVSAMKAGAVDFLEKPVRRDVLLEAIRCAVERTNRLRMEAAAIGKLKVQYERLTPREREVFALVSAGLLNKQVAAQLGTAEKTVKQHRGSIMRKIEAESLVDLVLMAERLGVRPTGASFGEAKGRLFSMVGS